MVNTAPYGGASGAARDPFGILEGGGKSISWAISDQWGNQTSVPPGTYHDIEITEDPEVRQDTHFADDPGGKFKKGELKFYTDGNPVESFIVTGRVLSPTIQPEDENDDLVRRDYFRGQKRRALQDAFKAINVRPADGFGHGTVLRITLTGFKPTQNGAPQKLYDVQFLKYVPRASAAFGSLEQGQAPQPPQQQPGQYVTPTQWAASPQAAPQAPQQQVPQQQYAPPAPPQAPAQPQYAPPAAPPQQPVQQAPQAPVGVPAVQAAGYTEVPQQAPQAAPAAPAVPAGGAPAVLQSHVDKVTMAIGVGIDRAGAIQAVADEVAAGNPEFRAALDSHIPF